ncbi:MAG: hypothetical protein WD851_09360 [Pirellulales bacterium]
MNLENRIRQLEAAASSTGNSDVATLRRSLNAIDGDRACEELARRWVIAKQAGDDDRAEQTADQFDRYVASKYGRELIA